MPRTHVIIGVPTLGVVSTRWALAFSTLQRPMNSVSGVVCEHGFEVGVARNRIVARVLALGPRPTHVFFLDDDVLPHPHALLQLLKADRDIVSGVYFTKGEFSEPLMFAPPGEGIVPYVPGSGLVEVWGHGMGLTLIRTGVFERMRDELDLGTDRQGNPRWYYTSGDEPGEGTRATEDLYFLARAHELGIPCFVDTHPYALGWHYCKDRHVAYPRPQWEEFNRTGGATFEFPDDLAHLLVREEP